MTMRILCGAYRLAPVALKTVPALGQTLGQSHSLNTRRYSTEPLNLIVISKQQALDEYRILHLKNDVVLYSKINSSIPKEHIEKILRAVSVYHKVLDEEAIDEAYHGDKEPSLEAEDVFLEGSTEVRNRVVALCNEISVVPTF